MRKVCFLFLTVFLILLCGCTGYREIDRGYLVTCMGISKTGEEYSIFLEVLSSSDVSDKPSEKQVLTSVGNSLYSSFEGLETQLTKPLYFDQLGSVIFDNSLNEESIEFLKNITNINYGVYLVKSDKINALFTFESPNGVLGYDIIGLIKNHNKKSDKRISNQFFKVTKPSARLPIITISNDRLTLNY